MNVSTSVVILTRDELPQLQQTLTVLADTVGDDACEYIIVDDGSHDDTSAWLSEVDAVHLIHRLEPHGWMAAMNSGIREAHGDSILVIRAGAIIPAVTWQRLRTAFYSLSSRKGQMGAIYPLGNIAFHVLNIMPGLKYSNLAELETEVTRREDAEIEGTIFLENNCLLLAKQGWTDIGGLQEDYGDSTYGLIDMGLRLWQHGWAVRCCRSAYVHMLSQSADEIAMSEAQKLFEMKWRINLDYSCHLRRDLLPWLDYTQPDFSLLVAGCACGLDMLYVCDANPTAEVQGIEIDSDAAAIASTFAPVTSMDIEKLDRPDWHNKFSAIMMGDIVEHLRDPWQTLRNMYECTRPGGRIVISVPNITNISIFYNMLAGRWTYDDAGILDRTHLRFFTRMDAIDLVTQAGYQLKNVSYNMVPLPEAVKVLRAKLLPLLHDGAESFDLDAFQWIIVADK